MPTSSAGKRQKGGGNSGILKTGETLFLSADQNGKPITLIAVSGSGENAEYRYTGYIPKETPKPNSGAYDYREAVRNAAIKTAMASGGKVKASGGLYSKAGKTFKSVEAFKQDALQRLDSKIAEQREILQRKKQGYITQIAAENMKSSARNDASYHTTIDRIGRDVRGGIQSAADRLAGLEQARARILASI